MPKECVYGVPMPFMPETSDSPRENRSPIVEVGWSRTAGDVQVASRIRECEVFFDPDRPDAPIPCEYGFYVSLDRAGVNELIRHLRKARDQAFGRDE